MYRGQSCQSHWEGKEEMTSLRGEGRNDSCCFQYGPLIRNSPAQADIFLWGWGRGFSVALAPQPVHFIFWKSQAHFIQRKLSSWTAAVLHLLRRRQNHHSNLSNSSNPFVSGFFFSNFADFLRTFLRRRDYSPSIFGLTIFSIDQT